MTGRLLGIARKPRPKAPVETIDRAAVGMRTGIAGDHRGTIAPGGKGRRQVTVMALADWQAALGDLGDAAVAWSDRRVNLLVDGIALPRTPGALLRVGTALFEITAECDPCSRMDGVAPGLRAALTPDWRGGRTMRVREAGMVAIGDTVDIEFTDLAEAV